MKVIVVGLGVQGHKRRDIAAGDCVAVVDPVHPEADYPSVEDVPLEQFDAALVCTPDGAKMAVLSYLLSHKKHVLVEKPLIAGSTNELAELQQLAVDNSVCCYTAYNHRFEPHFMRMKQAIDEGSLGRVYSVRLFYGNGTARLVRNSPWRDQGSGVLHDLGSHLLDTLLFWFGEPDAPFRLVAANRFENQAPDHCIIAANSTVHIEAEMTLLSWRNHFTADIFAERGSAHIRSLCKWGPTTFTLRDRKLPSGKPDEESVTLAQPDPTWQAEYDHFLQLCASGGNNIDNDIWIHSVLNHLSVDIEGGPQ